MKRFIALFAILFVATPAIPVGVAYKTSTRDIIEIGYSDMTQYVGSPDTTVVNIPEQNISRPLNGVLSSLAFSATSQAVILKPTALLASATLQFEINQDTQRLIEINGLFNAALDLSSRVGQKLQFQIAICTNSYITEVQRIKAKY